MDMSKGLYEQSWWNLLKPEVKLKAIKHWKDTYKIVDEKIFNGELKAYLRNAMSKLNTQQLLVVELYYVKELNVYEIAEILSVSTGRVSQIKSAAIALLRKKIELELK